MKKSFVLSTLKNNLARFPEPLGFEISDAGLHFGEAPKAPRVETQADKACDLLRTLLDKGPVLSEELEKEAKGAGLSWDTMKRAKKRLRIIAKRNGVTRKWSWALPVRE